MQNNSKLQGDAKLISPKAEDLQVYQMANNIFIASANFQSAESTSKKDKAVLEGL